MLNNNLFKNSLHYNAAVSIVRHLHTLGFEAFFAGGFVRNLFLESDDNADIDIATNATPQVIKDQFPRTVAVGVQFGVVIVIQNDIPFEVATFRSDVGVDDGRHPQKIVFSTAREDALRRDFTINGMFFDPLTETLHDFVGGQEDIKCKMIRAIGNPDNRFTEDYLRMLRALRFAARLQFTIDESTWNSLCRQVDHITRISAERIYAELTKMITGLNPDKALILLRDSGILSIILPEIYATIGIEQPPEFHPEGDVFVHTLCALRELCNPTPVLAWSTLLHDIGKPSTQTYSDRIRFNNHNTVGAQMAEIVLRRLKAPGAIIEAVFECIHNHMNFTHVTLMRLGTLKKFLARPTITDELELHRIDCLASHGDISNYYFIKKKLEEFAAEQIKPEPFLKGKDLLALNITPGPVFGTIIEAAYDLQLDETITTRDQALEWLKEYITKNNI